ncbi:spondin domain-containing protein [Halorhabdus rudnickae]|uniref:spondin domain-containing protein n=1 Tax=Halorhabdus rudnickae TaxID=1775544 RepID=UPI0010838A23|nr:spondin domain-containing protein [Halorhabdus rudnickae]
MTADDQSSTGRTDSPLLTRRTFVAGAGGTLLGAGVLGSAAAQMDDGPTMRSFTVTIENVSTPETLETTADGDAATQPVPLAPGAYAVHTSDEPMFSMGESPRHNGLQALAEDGKPGTLAEHLSMRETVSDSGTVTTPVGADGPGPLTPGNRYEFTVHAESGQPATYLSLATMFVPSNDLFYALGGPDGAMLFDDGQPLSGDVTDMVTLYDAGTEINEEPGVGENQPQRQRGAGAGLVERGTVAPVDEIAGHEYPAVSDVLSVSVTPADTTDDDM